MIDFFFYSLLGSIEDSGGSINNGGVLPILPTTNDSGITISNFVLIDGFLPYKVISTFGKQTPVGWCNENAVDRQAFFFAYLRKDNP